MPLIWHKIQEEEKQERMRHSCGGAQRLERIKENNDLTCRIGYGSKNLYKSN